MALNATTLGQELYNVRAYFSDKTEAQLVSEFGSMDEVRKEICKREAAAIIDHFKNYAEGRYQAGTLVASSVPVTATASLIAIRLT